MFGAHLPQLAILLVVALMVFGPKRLPEIGSGLGRGIRDFRKHVSEVETHTSIEDTPVAQPVPVAVVEPHVVERS